MCAEMMWAVAHDVALAPGAAWRGRAGLGQDPFGAQCAERQAEGLAGTAPPHEARAGAVPADADGARRRGVVC